MQDHVRQKAQQTLLRVAREFTVQHLLGTHRRENKRALRRKTGNATDSMALTMYNTPKCSSFTF
jgi:hypothetical protein